MNNIIRQVTFDSANRRKDGSVKISFTTDLEQNTSQFMELDEVRDTHGILYYSQKSELTKEELNAIDKCDIEITGKSRSEKLRRKIMALHNNTRSIESKEDYYKKWMNHFESLLDSRFIED